MIYEAKCGECSLQFDYVSAVAERNNVPGCPKCGGAAGRVIATAPLGVVTGKFEAYKSMVDGSVIRNQRDLKEHNRRNGVVLLGEGYSEETLKSGNLGQKKTELCKKELAQDIQEAAKEVYQGYEPTIQNEGAEL